MLQEKHLIFKFVSIIKKYNLLTLKILVKSGTGAFSIRDVL